MSAHLEVTLRFADALVDEAPGAGLTAVKVDDSTVNVTVPDGADGVEMMHELAAYAYRFGIDRIKVVDGEASEVES